MRSKEVAYNLTIALLAFTIMMTPISWAVRLPAAVVACLGIYGVVKAAR